MIGIAAPAEVEFGWIYFPPIVFVILIGIVVASLTGTILNRTGLSRYFWNPGLAWLSFVVIAGGLFGLFVLAP